MLSFYRERLGFLKMSLKLGKVYHAVQMNPNVAPHHPVFNASGFRESYRVLGQPLLILIHRRFQHI